LIKSIPLRLSVATVGVFFIAVVPFCVSVDEAVA
jgi:hypothetical protein